MEYVLGVVATVCSLLSNIIGAGSQVKFHYETKQVELTKLFVTLSLTTHIAWMMYGISINSIFMIITQAVGGTLSFTLFVQKFFIYPKKEPEKQIPEIKNPD